MKKTLSLLLLTLCCLLASAAPAKQQTASVQAEKKRLLTLVAEMNQVAKDAAKQDSILTAFIAAKKPEAAQGQQATEKKGAPTAEKKGPQAAEKKGAQVVAKKDTLANDTTKQGVVSGIAEAPIPLKWLLVAGIAVLALLGVVLWLLLGRRKHAKGPKPKVKVVAIPLPDSEVRKGVLNDLKFKKN